MGGLVRLIRSFAPLFAVLVLAAANPPASFAQESYPAAASPEAAAASSFLADYLAEIDRVRGQIAALAEAMPQETHTWRPVEGVRSAGEVYLHMAFGNYLLLRVAGYATPADLADQLEVAKLQAWDTATSEKAAIAERLSRSFDHLRSTVAAIPADELDSRVEFFGKTPTKRQLLLILLGHLHEHLGQSIAYARMNGVVPPWTAAQQQATAAQSEGGD